MSHTPTKHVDLHDLSKRLQHEVDSILNSVDEKGLYAEFQELEITEVDEMNGAIIINEAIDDRIMARMSRHQEPKRTAKDIINYLFKPLIA